jgi:hypothetical protein
MKKGETVLFNIPVRSFLHFILSNIGVTYLAGKREKQ